MSTDTSPVVRSPKENWLPVLELAIEEVFEIMLGQRVKPAPKGGNQPPAGFTAMVGIAGGLCGILTVSCDKAGAREIAKSMLGPEIADSEEQVSDALGEVCNMIAGNFESGSSQMKSTSQDTFDRIAKLLRERQCQIRVEGHTDDIPIHNVQFSSNWELSASRATEIVRLLIVRDGYNPARLSAAGYAEFHPVAANATAEGRSLNRRVDIVILRQDAPRPPVASASAPAPAPASQPLPVTGLAIPPPIQILPPKHSAGMGAKPSATSPAVPRR
jgi:outer membrane protein OmpA-like peptidoglycan-associated protein